IVLQLQPDVVLIEGHKKASYSKALLLRSEEEMHLMKELTNVCAVISWDAKVIKSNDANFETPFFSIGDPKGPDWIVEYLVSERMKKR
ncbi:molybdopterin-guanine dinucleotide biosynthesis protein B, partial [Cytobacillus firmus]